MNVTVGMTITDSTGRRVTVYYHKSGQYFLCPVSQPSTVSCTNIGTGPFAPFWRVSICPNGGIGVDVYWTNPALQSNSTKLTAVLHYQSCSGGGVSLTDANGPPVYFWTEGY